MNAVGLEGDPCEPHKAQKKPKEAGSYRTQEGWLVSFFGQCQARLTCQAPLNGPLSLPPSAEVAMGTPQHRQSPGGCLRMLDPVLDSPMTQP